MALTGFLFNTLARHWMVDRHWCRLCLPVKRAAPQGVTRVRCLGHFGTDNVRIDLNGRDYVFFLFKQDSFLWFQGSTRSPTIKFEANRCIQTDASARRAPVSGSLLRFCSVLALSSPPAGSSLTTTCIKVSVDHLGLCLQSSINSTSYHSNRKERAARLGHLDSEYFHICQHLNLEVWPIRGLVGKLTRQLAAATAAQ